MLHGCYSPLIPLTATFSYIVTNSLLDMMLARQINGVLLDMMRIHSSIYAHCYDTLRSCMGTNIILFYQHYVLLR